MRKIRLAGFLVLLTVVFAGPLSAKMINGKVTMADAQTQKLVVQTADPVSGGVLESEIWVNADAVWSGADSFSALKTGDMVWVEAEQDSEGNWKASKITKA